MDEEGDGVWVMSYPQGEMQMEKLNPLCEGLLKNTVLEYFACFAMQ